MIGQRTIYGWVQGGYAFLSAFPYESGHTPVNFYTDQTEAVTAVSRRKVRIVWQEVPEVDTRLLEDHSDG